MKNIAIIIPTYNELENIEQLVNEIHINLPEISIFIIDDSKTKEIGDLIFSKNIKAKYFHRSNESGRGSAGMHIISTGKPEPYRVKISPGSFRNLIALPYLLKGEKLGNMPAVYWSLNYWPVEADR